MPFDTQRTKNCTYWSVKEDQPDQNDSIRQRSRALNLNLTSQFQVRFHDYKYKRMTKCASIIHVFVSCAQMTEPFYYFN